MSATDIIEQIKTLPADQQREVAQFVGQLVQASDDRSAVRPGFPEAAEEMFDRYDNLFRELAK